MVNVVDKDVRRYFDPVPEDRRPLVQKLHALIIGLYPEAQVDMKTPDVSQPTRPSEDRLHAGTGRIAGGRLFDRDQPGGTS